MMVTRVREVEEKDVTQNSWFPESASGGPLMKTANPAGVEEKGYYGVPMLKRPLWKWEIALYFFFEGISAGSYMIAAMAELFAKNRYSETTRAARYISLAALLPCPPLLIIDLGRPERFHHMLRVWKPKSPMNLGAWALSGYSLPVGLLAFKQLTGDVPQTPAPLKKAGALVPSRAVGAAGIPFALAMLSYPGVLLSTTSTPVWARTRFLGALFASSSMATGAAALSLALALRGKGSGDRELEALERIESLARLFEGTALAAYLLTTKESAKPLVSGRYSKHLWLGAVGAGLVLPTLLGALSSPRRKAKRRATILSSALTLVGGLTLKWAVAHAGRASAEDSQAARDATRPSDSSPGWSSSPAGHSGEALTASGVRP
jgi:formate-dependent nitrite reductase membrane component NrfD